MYVFFSILHLVHFSETGRFDGPEPAALWGLTSGAHDVLVRSVYLNKCNNN